MAGLVQKKTPVESPTGVVLFRTDPGSLLLGVERLWVTKPPV
jgi:hypothetical protein